jgi:hypothetical protein
VNLLAVSAVDVPGEPELRLLDAARRLRGHGWDTTISTPGDAPLSEADFPWVHLDVGGLGQGEGARAVACCPRCAARTPSYTSTCSSIASRATGTRPTS